MTPTDTQATPVHLGPDTEFAMNLLLLKHSSLRDAMNQVSSVQADDGSLTAEVQTIVTQFFQTIFQFGQANGGDVAAAVLSDSCFQALIVQTWTNRNLLSQVQAFLDLTPCYDPMDPIHPTDRQSYSIFSKLSGVS
jgi:hypothetical protein